MAGYSLVIQDADYEQAYTEAGAHCEKLESALEQYHSILEGVTNGAISSGSLHDALCLFMDYVVKARYIVNGTGEKIVSLIQDFQNTVDSIDDYLYVKDLNPVRDFSQKEYEYLKTCLDDPWFELEDRLDDWATGLIKKAAEVIHWKWFTERFQNTHSLLLDYNNETLEGLTAIFDGVHNADRDFHGRLELPLQVLKELDEIIVIMADLLSPGNSHLSVKQINDRLGGKYSQLADDFLKALQVPDSKSKPSIEKIGSFAELAWADQYFFPYRVCAGQFVSDLGGWQAAQMVLFQMFEIGRTTMIEGNYNDYMYKKELLDLLKDFMGEDSGLFEDAAYKEDYESMRSMLKYAKDGGDWVYKYLNSHRYGDDKKLILDGRTREAKEFKGMLESFSSAGKILKYGEQGIDFLSKALADYSACLEVLESYERNFSDDPNMAAAIREVKDLYNKEFDSWLDEGLKIIQKDGIDLVLKEMQNPKNFAHAPVLSVLSAIDTTIEVTGKVTGYGTEAVSMYKALTLYNMGSSMEDAYAKSIEKLREADPTDENYAQLVQDARNCFDLNKKNNIDMFNAMAGASTGTKRSYYLYLRKLAEQSTMFDTSKPDPLSYDEFVKTYG